MQYVLRGYCSAARLCNAAVNLLVVQVLQNPFDDRSGDFVAVQRVAENADGQLIVRIDIRREIFQEIPVRCIGGRLRVHLALILFDVRSHMLTATLNDTNNVLFGTFSAQFSFSVSFYCLLLSLVVSTSVVNRICVFCKLENEKRNSQNERGERTALLIELNLLWLW